MVFNLLFAILLTYKRLIMSIVKVIEVIASSEKSFDEATRNAVSEASKSVKNIKSVYIENMNANVENNQITTFAVNAKVSFEIDK
jgi:hypothetical protein